MSHFRRIILQENGRFSRIILWFYVIIMRGASMQSYRAGIDVGSTTVKLVLLDEQDHVVFGEYRRHMAHTQ